MRYKIILLLSTVITILSSLQTEAVGKKRISNDSFEQGTNNMNLGIGFPSLLTPTFKVWENNGIKTTSLPPISLSYEYGITEKFSIGPYLAYSTTKITMSLPNLPTIFMGWDYKFILVGGRASFHFATTETLDPYLGVMAGYKITSQNTFASDEDLHQAFNHSLTDPYFVKDHPEPAFSHLAYNIHLGARYLITDNFGAFAEAGYGVSLLTVGVTVKFIKKPGRNRFSFN